MGMFDEIQCKVPLPAKKGLKTAAEWKNYTFQTKDLDNFIGHYEIRKSGLWVKEIKYKPTTKETPRGKEKKGNKWDKGWCFAPLEIESERWVKENFTGYICFYDFVHDADDAHDLWIEFGGHFDKGKLQGKIELNKWKEESNVERKANTKKWKEEAKARKEYKEKWRYKYCFKHWNRFVRWDCRLNRRFHHWWLRVIDKLERWATIGK
jgi:hypothetical protein